MWRRIIKSILKSYSQDNIIVDTETDSKKTYLVDDNKLDELLEVIDRCMVNKKLYLNYSLTLDDVARAVGSNRTYVSRAINSKYKSFLLYVNNFRLEELNNILEDESIPYYSALTNDDIAMSSGFSGQRQMKKYINGDYAGGRDVLKRKK